MIRSGRIPPVLSRICGDGIQASLLVTTDGELLGTSYPVPDELGDLAELGTLVTEIATDYMRLGHELVLLRSDEHDAQKQSELQFVELELEEGLVGVANAGMDCLVVAIADPKVLSGMLKARLQALAHHVQEALTPLTEPT